jgi:glycine cleavage system regulatory protein
VVGIIDLVAREGGDWKESRLKHVGGLAVWLLAVAVLSGRVTL